MGKITNNNPRIVSQAPEILPKKRKERDPIQEVSQAALKKMAVSLNGNKASLRKRLERLEIRMIKNLNKKDILKTLEICETILDITPTHSYALKIRHDLLKNKLTRSRKVLNTIETIYGLVYLKDEQPTLAKRNFDRAIRMNPRDAMAFACRGNLHLKQGDKEAALRDFNEANAIDPQALKDFQTLLKKHPKNNEILEAIQSLQIEKKI